jgi:primosomal protein N' (replication factor Y) (superfamily II helicase)
MIEEVLKNGGQILLFTPTIRSSEDMASILRDRFDIEVQLVNSAPQGFKHYAEALNLIRLGNVRIVVSNRKGILIPFHNLKLIVIEDEHSSNHKHYGTNIYCVREAALIRARILNIPLLMSSSTPSSKTFQKSVEQEYKLLDLSHDQDRPKLEIIDINKQDIDNLRMSSDLHHEIAKTLASHKQVMIFLNRIGYSRKLTCTKCSTNIYCSECKANLTLFLDPNPHFSCRACNKFHYPLDELCCQVCGGNVIMKAMGTEKIEYHMKTKYPDSTVIRVDSKSDYYLQDTIERIERHEVDIIVATELINQKIPFSHIGLICVIDIDYIMLSEDWGDLEKTVGLIVDLAESAGTNARTIIQSSIPGNRYIKALETFDYRVMMDCLNKRLNSLENQIKTYQVNILIQETSKERMVDRAKEIMNYLLANRTNTTDVGRFGLRRKPVISGKWRGYIKVQSEMLDELYNLLKPLRKGHNCRLDFVPENIRP